MNRLITTSLLLLVWVLGYPQGRPGNVFLDRNFWLGKPSLEEVKEQIEAGHDPIVLNKHGFNGVTYAMVFYMPFEIAKYLVDLEGNELHTITHDGRSYLHWAARSDVKLTRYLIQKGLKTSDVDSHGYTVLTFAATTGQKNPELYDCLLNNGASLIETNHDGANALLLLAPHLKDMQMLDYFTDKGLSLQVKDKHGNGVFYYTARTGNIPMMKLLVAQGVAFKGLNDAGGNAMISASQGRRGSTNNLEVFQYLEQLGIEPNVITSEGTTPLTYLARNTKDTEVIDFFLDKGVDINQKDHEGATALIHAASSNDLPIITYIAEKTADLNATTVNGKTALTEAVARNKVEVVSYLLGKGANAGIQDADGNSLAYYLIKSYRPGGSKAFEAKLTLLKEAGVDLKARQRQGNSLFHLAVETNDLYLVKAIGELGLDVNTQNDDNLSPLQMAAMKATDAAILQYLIDAGADKSVKTDFEESVYDLASENEALQAAGVDIAFLL